MKTELDKCMAGEWYDCHDPIFITQKGKTRQLLARYNALPYEEKKTKQEVLKEMFGSIGNNVSVGTPFLCDYGCNIHIGDNVSVNMNCSFIDCNNIQKILLQNSIFNYNSLYGLNLINEFEFYSSSCDYIGDIFGLTHNSKYCGTSQAFPKLLSEVKIFSDEYLSKKDY